ncbi:hypothetical protein DFH06DRAFT_1141511 [Mycena polygramma]|nr:hypothetical protein DFH06DRAFT_1141511 [Mycena polygramma]
MHFSAFVLASLGFLAVASAAPADVTLIGAVAAANTSSSFNTGLGISMKHDLDAAKMCISSFQSVVFAVQAVVAVNIGSIDNVTVATLTVAIQTALGAVAVTNSNCQAGLSNAIPTLDLDRTKALLASLMDLQAAVSALASKFTVAVVKLIMNVGVDTYGTFVTALTGLVAALNLLLILLLTKLSSIAYAQATSIVLSITISLGNVSAYRDPSLRLLYCETMSLICQAQTLEAYDYTRVRISRSKFAVVVLRDHVANMPSSDLGSL